MVWSRECQDVYGLLSCTNATPDADARRVITAELEAIGENELHHLSAGQVHVLYDYIFKVGCGCCYMKYSNSYMSGHALWKTKSTK